MNRKTWDHIWSELALSIAERSVSERLKVGAVIITQDNSSVLALGYNGLEVGGANEVDSERPGGEGTVHAELNALIKLPYTNSQERKMYITHTPCITCARAIVNAKISEVIAIDMYRDASGLNLLNERGINAYLLDEGVRAVLHR